MKELKCDRGSEVRIKGGKHLALLSQSPLIVMFVCFILLQQLSLCMDAQLS